MKNEIRTLSVGQLSVHPKVKVVFRDKPCGFMKFSMKTFGQQQPISVLKISDEYFIIDGVVRWTIALEQTMETMDCRIININDNEIIDYRIKVNQKTKTTLTETCLNAEHLLGILGNSQGKKRELLGFEKFEDEKYFGSTGKDRFELTCILLDLEMSSVSLRKLMKIFWAESDSDSKSLGLLELINSGKISIHKAYKLLVKSHSKEQEKKEKEKRDYEGGIADVWYKLYNTSSMDMSAVDDEIATLAIQSPPYLKLKKYRNQDELAHGQEDTVEEYIENEIKFARQIRRKLTKDGVYIVIVGETYRGGYKGVCSKLEIALEKDGWVILDVNCWVKSNPRPQPHDKFFQPAYERIIVCCKKDGNPKFNPIYKPKIKAIKEKIEKSACLLDGTSNFWLNTGDVPITNVINTPVFNPNRLKEIDPQFTHDAPCPSEIYKIFIEAYSSPNDIVIDGFIGSGQIGCALEMGRSVIGFDVDPVSLKYCHKSFQKILGGRKHDKLKIAA